MDMTEAAIDIRSAREDELDKVAEVIIDAYAEYAAKMSPDAWSSFAVDIANVRGRASDAEILIAEREGSIVGTVSHYAQWRGAQRDTSALRLLAVPPSEQGEGVGRALMAYCIESARGAGKRRVALTTVEEMEFMRDLALKMGFERETYSSTSWTAARRIGTRP
jgi:predicted N-acetyltransferase YhbS